MGDGAVLIHGRWCCINSWAMVSVGDGGRGRWWCAVFMGDGAVFMGDGAVLIRGRWCCINSWAMVLY